MEEMIELVAGSANVEKFFTVKIKETLQPVPLDEYSILFFIFDEDGNQINTGRETCVKVPVEEDEDIGRAKYVFTAEDMENTGFFRGEFILQADDLTLIIYKKYKIIVRASNIEE